MAARKKPKKAERARPNRQPFYHSLTLIFTATEDLTSTKSDMEDDLRRLFRERFGTGSSPHLTMQIDSFDAEPGDPADLM